MILTTPLPKQDQHSGSHNRNATFQHGEYLLLPTSAHSVHRWGFTATAVSPQHSFGACCGYNQKVIAVRQSVADMPERASVKTSRSLIREGCQTARTPVDNVITTIDQAFVIELAKHFTYSLESPSSMVKRSRSVARGSQLRNARAIVPPYYRATPTPASRNCHVPDRAGNPSLRRARPTNFGSDCRHDRLPGSQTVLRPCIRRSAP